MTNMKRLLTNPVSGDVKTSILFRAYTVEGNEMGKQIDVCLPMEDLEALYRFHRQSLMKRFLTSLAEKF